MERACFSAGVPGTRPGSRRCLLVSGVVGRPTDRPADRVGGSPRAVLSFPRCCRGDAERRRIRRAWAAERARAQCASMSPPDNRAGSAGRSSQDPSIFFLGLGGEGQCRGPTETGAVSGHTHYRGVTMSISGRTSRQVRAHNKKRKKKEGGL